MIGEIPVAREVSIMQSTIGVSEISATKMMRTACKAIAPGAVCETVAADMPPPKVSTSKMCEAVAAEMAASKVSATAKVATSKMMAAAEVMSSAVATSRVRRYRTNQRVDRQQRRGGDNRHTNCAKHF
jgi:molybdopterin-binding protein